MALLERKQQEIDDLLIANKRQAVMIENLQKRRDHNDGLTKRNYQLRAQNERLKDQVDYYKMKSGE